MLPVAKSQIFDAKRVFAGKILKAKSIEAMLMPEIRISSRHQFSPKVDEVDGVEARKVELAYSLGWGALIKTKFGPAFFKEGHGDGAQNYMIFFKNSQKGMILLTNSDNGEIAFRLLLETILGDTVTPWEWEGYTPELIEESRKHP